MNTTTNEKTTRQRSSEATAGLIRRRLIISILAALVVSVIAVLVTAMVDPALWVQSAISSVTVAIPCSLAAIWLARRIINKPQESMNAWMLTLFVHFTAVIAGGLYLTVNMHFNPITAIFVGFLPAMVFVFANAWIVQALTAGSSSLNNNQPGGDDINCISPTGSSIAPCLTEDPS